MPFLSVVISSFNNSNKLDLMLKYLFLQETALSPEQLEVIVVNDCSTDHIEDVIGAWQQKKSNFRVINHSENKGLAASRNTGARDAKGKVLLFLDNDIILTPGVLESHLAYFQSEQNENRIILSQIYNLQPETYESAIKYLSEADGLDMDYLMKYRSSEIDPYFDIRHEMLNSGKIDSDTMWVFGALFCASMYKTTWEKIGGFDENFKGWGPEDIEFDYRAHNLGCKFIFNDKAVCFHMDYQKKDKELFFQSVQRNAKYLFLKHPTPEIKNYLRFYKGDISFEEFNALLKGEPFIANEHSSLHYLGILKFLYKKTE